MPSPTRYHAWLVFGAGVLIALAGVVLMVAAGGSPGVLFGMGVATAGLVFTMLAERWLERDE